jgi:spore maturation protein CgeB
MQDLSLNSDFSVHLNGRNDLATVEGVAAFEQSVAIMLTDFMYNSIPGRTERDSIKERLRLEINRVASEHDFVDEIASISITEKVGAEATYAVEVKYISNDYPNFTEETTVQ